MKEFPGDTSGNDLLAKTEDKEILFPSLGGESSLDVNCSSLWSGYSASDLVLGAGDTA